MASPSEWYFIIAILSALGLCTVLACCCACREFSRGRQGASPWYGPFRGGPPAPGGAALAGGPAPPLRPAPAPPLRPAPAPAPAPAAPPPSGGPRDLAGGPDAV
jgi:hypothetical protein